MIQKAKSWTGRKFRFDLKDQAISTPELTKEIEKVEVPVAKKKIVKELDFSVPRKTKQKKAKK